MEQHDGEKTKSLRKSAPGVNLYFSWCSQAQALLRWHESHQYCSKTGQTTQKNLAGSKRVCHASGITYYPQVST
ncbi:NADH pyrophosphatase zinc ribbon domain-containing protein [Salmonella sp. gx-f5]|uniref:NADH pyrophosphatase zinc ribbon domain-containing protein n=1 Tax=Salmonella sp. gx-f5 TaxID=2582605 RepID=UPI0013726EE0|nr:hypothetical protein [Salmonella sp. gx-f5]